MLCLVRHGQAQWQVSPSDDFDTPLSALGHDQARCLASWLEQAPGRRPARLFTSPLLRARQTSSYLEKALGARSDICEDLREAPFRVADLLPSRPTPLCGWPDGACAQEYSEFRGRAQRALEFLYTTSQVAGPVLAVTHGGLIKTLIRVAAGTDHICFEIANASTTQLDWRDGRWRIVRLSQAEYLPESLQSI